MSTDFNPFSLEGKTIVVTGASSGIGRQCAIDCSRMGAKVVLLARNVGRLQETISMLDGTSHSYVTVELTVSDQVDDAVSTIRSTYGKIDGLVNCAGISTTLPLKLVTESKLVEFFSANVYSAIELTRRLASLKCMNPGGSIIFMSSIMACVGEAGKSIYSMTKGALVSAAKSIACELARRSIRVNCISPGAILTPINANLPHMRDPELRKRLENQHLLGLGKTEDISYAVIYLLSDASRWVTGQNLIIDGGYTAR